MSENNELNPMSGEQVEIDGVYSNEWGREEEFHRGEVFSADPQLGTTAWQLVELTTDERHSIKQDPQSGPRRHFVRGDH